MIDVNDIPVIDELIIEIYSKEGDYIPHFHFYTKDNKIDGCMQIFKPEYFIHGRHKSILTNDQLKKLIEFLNTKEYEPVNDINKWQEIVLAWFGDNYPNKDKYKNLLKNKNITIDLVNMPNYLELLK